MKPRLGLTGPGNMVDTFRPPTNPSDRTAAFAFRVSFPARGAPEGRVLPMAADYVFVNGEVVTVNSGDDVAEAVAVDGDAILAVGTTEEVLCLRGPGTRVVDLQGNSLLPGFVDSHLHMLLYGTNNLGVDCKNGVGSIGEIVDRLAEKAARTPPGGWVRGWGYNEQKLSGALRGLAPRRHDPPTTSQSLAPEPSSMIGHPG